MGLMAVRARRAGVKKFGSDSPDVAIHTIQRGTR
jgi:hypothetical protein